MSATPEQVKKWLMVIATAGGMLSAGAGSTYSFLLNTGMIGGKLEKVNMILADEHIGEEPIEVVVVKDQKSPLDKQIAFNFENGDTLFFRHYKDNGGEEQKLKRWTSRRSIDDIINTAMLEMEFQFVKRAHAGTIAPQSWDKYTGEEYVGENSDGNDVYFIPEENVCEVHDAGTGEILETLAPPCEQYVVPGQKQE